MKISKLIPLSLVALMGAGLTGCSGGGSSDKIIIWATAAEEAVVNKLLTEYNKAVDDEFKIGEIDYVAVAEKDAGTEVAKNSSDSLAPDLFLAVDDHIYNLQSKNIVLNLTDSSYAKNIKDNNIANAVSGATYNKKIYGFPVTNDNGYFLMYNSKFLKDNEVGSLEKILEVAKDAGKHVMFDITDGYYAASLFLSPGVAGTDSLKFKENSNGDVIYDIKWDTDNAVKGFDAMTKLYKDYKNTFVVANNSNVVSEMTEETACCAIFGNWVYDTIKDSLKGDLKATKLPTIKVGTADAQLASFSGSKLYCINATKTDDKAQERRMKAAKFADFITNKESQLVRFEERGTIPCNKEALADKDYTSKKTDAAKALDAQNEAASAVQSVCAEGRYWDVGSAIGRAIKDNDIGTYKNTKAFLTAECKILREAA